MSKRIERIVHKYHLIANGIHDYIEAAIALESILVELDVALKEERREQQQLEEIENELMERTLAQLSAREDNKYY